MEPVKYECVNDQIATIKWCRKNFGERSDGRDYERSGKPIMD